MSTIAMEMKSAESTATRVATPAPVVRKPVNLARLSGPLLVRAMNNEVIEFIQTHKDLLRGAVRMDYDEFAFSLEFILCFKEETDESIGLLLNFERRVYPRSMEKKITLFLRTATPELYEGTLSMVNQFPESFKIIL